MPTHCQLDTRKIQYELVRCQQMHRKSMPSRQTAAVFVHKLFAQQNHCYVLYRTVYSLNRVRQPIKIHVKKLFHSSSDTNISQCVIFQHKYILMQFLKERLVGLLVGFIVCDKNIHILFANDQGVYQY